MSRLCSRPRCRWSPLVGSAADPLPGRRRRRASSAAVPAVVESSLATGNNQIRQFAFDGDPDTFFASEKNATKDDHFTLVFDAPVNVKSVRVTTGRPKGGDALAPACWKCPPTARRSTELAKFADGDGRRRRRSEGEGRSHPGDRRPEAPARRPRDRRSSPTRRSRCSSTRSSSWWT